MKYISRLVLKLAGWRFKGELPTEKKAVIISVPHTSGWDFVWGKLIDMVLWLGTFIIIKSYFFFFL